MLIGLKIFLISSNSGYCVFVGGNLMTWQTKKQSDVAGSSVEGEYRGMA